MRWPLEIVSALWLFGTPFAALVAAAWGVRQLVLGRGRLRVRLGLLVAAVAVSALALLANPVVNMGVFKGTADRARAEMIEDAKKASCVGQPTSWLEQRYGRPHRVASSGDWWYAPGPWYVVHDDYVGFSIANGLVTGVYVQVN